LISNLGDHANKLSQQVVFVTADPVQEIRS
jgi:hypothetical protein